MPSFCTTSPSPTRERLLAATDRYLAAFADNKTHPLTLLSYFSTTSPISIQHYPDACSHPQSSLLRGPNAIRSYYDLLATHFTRTCGHRHTLQVDACTRTVIFEGSVTWTWKRSGRSWVEEFTCTLVFDELLKIVSVAVRTDSAVKTCVLRAKDVDDSSPLSMMIGASSKTNKEPIHRVSVRNSPCLRVSSSWPDIWTALLRGRAWTGTLTLGMHVGKPVTAGCSASASSPPTSSGYLKRTIKCNLTPSPSPSLILSVHLDHSRW
ncbi:hypothetical protein LshimejAT787_0505980 [Lyophyllum shimeji]|uniref:SnoaL-like domain-containing protein n=1 Tax=Lyophyllum shimeji TaxID=47721 RepID=A0A9P3PNL1_LYOSH|nr:hypothetical protein LshimejAT787_0505980 [Lyophyllum shimeji]